MCVFCCFFNLASPAICRWKKWTKSSDWKSLTWLVNSCQKKNPRNTGDVNGLTVWNHPSPHLLPNSTIFFLTVPCKTMSGYMADYRYTPPKGMPPTSKSKMFLPVAYFVRWNKTQQAACGVFNKLETEYSIPCYPQRRSHNLQKDQACMLNMACKNAVLRVQTL